jgi:hypothetical protein
MLALTLIRQRRSLKAFGTIAREGGAMRASDNAGPALVGVIFPQLVVPADFEQRFSEQERTLILTHERAHLSSGDTRINALVVLLACLNWFNPLVHVAARLVRTDQELACDAAVVERFPGERRIYAEALLKTQIAPAPLPLGCTWPPRSSNLLKERVTMLARQTPRRVRRVAGVSLVAVLAGTLGFAAWAAQPPSPAPALERTASDSPAPQPTPAGPELPGDWQTHLKLMAQLMMAYRDRVIPLDHIIEASVTAETRNGEVLGPYRMYSSLPNDMRSSEFANGDRGFNADGDARFIGGMLGSVDVDGSLTLDFGMVVDDDPIVIERLKAQSGASVKVEKNGLKLTIHPLLRPMTDAELKRRIPSRMAPVKAKLEENSPAPQQGAPKAEPDRTPTDPHLKAIEDYLNLKFEQNAISPDDRARMMREFEGQLRLRHDPKSPPPKPEDMERFMSSLVWMTQPDGSTTIEHLTPEMKAEVDAIIAARKAPKSPETAARLKALEKQLAADLDLNGKPDPYVQGYIDQMVMRMSGAPGVTFSAAPREQRDQWPTEGRTLTCANFPSIWTADKRVKHDVLKSNAIVVKLDEHGLPVPDISQLADAFPSDAYPAGLAAGSPDRFSIKRGIATYTVASSKLVDTFNFSGLDDEKPWMVWQRVLITPAGPLSMEIQGSCRR